MALGKHSGIGTYKTLTIQRGNITRDTALAFDNELFSDCRFLVEGKTLHAQKAVLKNRSQYFQVMFSGEWKESNGEINISSHSYTVYKALLKYLYTGKVHISDEELLKLLQLAHETMHDDLVSSCTDILKLKLTAHNILDTYEVASNLDVGQLLVYCRQFAKIYLKEIILAHPTERGKLLQKLLVFVFTDSGHNSIADTGTTGDIADDASSRETPA